MSKTFKNNSKKMKKKFYQPYSNFFLSMFVFSNHFGKFFVNKRIVENGCGAERMLRLQQGTNFWLICRINDKTLIVIIIS